MKRLFFILIGILMVLTMNAQDAKAILQKVDDNMSSRNRVFESPFERFEQLTNIIPVALVG